MRAALLAALWLFQGPAQALAETAVYGEVDLTGLARDSWPLNDFAEHNTMVCNVNGPDGFLTIRAAPNAQAASQRKLNRLAIVVVDARQRQGRWVKVLDAYRTVTKDGVGQAYTPLPVTGWAHDGYLCDFIH